MSKTYLEPKEYVVDLSYSKNIFQQLNIPVSPDEEDTYDSDKVREEVDFDKMGGRSSIWETTW